MDLIVDELAEMTPPRSTQFWNKSHFSNHPDVPYMNSISSANF
jgi:hypothetical protein